MGERRNIRVGLVDDDVLTLAALRSLLTNRLSKYGISVIWSVRSGDAAVDRCLDERSRPDIVLVDMGMDHVDGAMTCRRIRRYSSTIVLLAMTSHALTHYADNARCSGAQALLDKADVDCLLRRLTAYSVGEDYVQEGFPTPQQAHAGKQLLAGGTETSLSSREREVMDWSVQGLTAAEVSYKMSISEATVKTHIRHAIAKLGVRNKLQAVRAWNERLGNYDR